MAARNAAPEPAAVARLAAELGRTLTANQAALLADYLDVLLRWRRRVNLVGPADWPTILSTLVADSWHLADFLAGPAEAHLPAASPLVLLDFGAGAGLPGIPLRAFYERGSYVLLESRAKRAIFLGEAVDRLSLPATRVVEGRVEQTVPGVLAACPDAFVLCLSRAFAPWEDFLDICRDLVRPPMAVLTMTGGLAGEAGSLPPGWTATARTAYPVAGKERYLTLFVPVASI